LLKDGWIEIRAGGGYRFASIDCLVLCEGLDIIGGIFDQFPRRFCHIMPKQKRKRKKKCQKESRTWLCLLHLQFVAHVSGISRSTQKVDKTFDTGNVAIDTEDLLRDSLDKCFVFSIVIIYTSVAKKKKDERDELNEGKGIYLEVEWHLRLGGSVLWSQKIHSLALDH
jgi:hypothetical protein